MSNGTESRVQRMLNHMARYGMASAERLAQVAQLPNSGRVSALLKSRIRSGEVERYGRNWRINPDWDEEMASELRDARILLERAGWTVIAPGSAKRDEH